MGKGTIFSLQEAIHFVRQVESRKKVLFGAFSPTATALKKKENWQIISDNLQVQPVLEQEIRKV